MPALSTAPERRSALPLVEQRPGEGDARDGLVVGIVGGGLERFAAPDVQICAAAGVTSHAAGNGLDGRFAGDGPGARRHANGGEPFAV